MLFLTSINARTEIFSLVIFVVSYSIKNELLITAKHNKTNKIKINTRQMISGLYFFFSLRKTSNGCSRFMKKGSTYSWFFFPLKSGWISHSSISYTLLLSLNYSSPSKYIISSMSSSISSLCSIFSFCSTKAVSLINSSSSSSS